MKEKHNKFCLIANDIFSDVLKSPNLNRKDANCRKTVPEAGTGICITRKCSGKQSLLCSLNTIHRRVKSCWTGVFVLRVHCCCYVQHEVLIKATIM